MRLAILIDCVVSCKQSAFVKGWHILDRPLMVKEVTEWYKKKQIKKKKNWCYWILILKRLYDSVSLDCIDSMMQFMNFGGKWWSWIRACLILARASIPINGIPTEEFQLHYIGAFDVYTLYLRSFSCLLWKRFMLSLKMLSLLIYFFSEVQLGKGDFIC